MSKYTVNFMEKKNEDWIVAQLVAEDGYETKDVSINRKSKSGELFPGFDDISPGGDVSGELWKSKAGKWYLFAPKPEPKGNFGRSKAISEAQDRKKNDIEEAQDNKNEAIRLAAAQRDAVLIVTQIFGKSVITEQDVKDEIKKWRNWLLSDEFKAPPF